MRILEISEFDLVNLSEKGRENFISRNLKEAGFDLKRPIARHKISNFKWLFKQEEDDEEEKNK